MLKGVDARSWKQITAALGLVLIGAACGTEPVGVDPFVYSRFAADAFETAPEGLALRVEYPTPVTRGDPVLFKVSLSNTDTAAILLGHNFPEYDLFITGPDGLVVWEMLYGLNLSDVMREMVLDPGETLEFSYSWNQRDNAGRALPRGEYLVRAVFFGNVYDPDATVAGQTSLWTDPAPLVIR